MNEFEISLGEGVAGSLHKKEVSEVSKSPGNMAVAKTILGILPKIDRYCEVGERANYSRAVNSITGADDTMTLMEKIIDCTFQIDRLRYLKSKVLQMLDHMPENMGAVLRHYFMDGGDTSGRAFDAKMGWAKNSTSRYFKEGVQYVAERLEWLGINYFTFKQIIRQFPWVRDELESHLG